MQIWTMAKDGDNIKWVKQDHGHAFDERQEKSLAEIVHDFLLSLGNNWQQVHWLVFSEEEQVRLEALGKYFLPMRGRATSDLLSWIVCNQNVLGMVVQVFATYVATDPNIPLKDADLTLAIQFGHNLSGQKYVIEDSPSD